MKLTLWESLHLTPHTSHSSHLSLLTPLTPHTSHSSHLSLLTPLTPHTSHSTHLSLHTPLTPHTSHSSHLSPLTPLTPHTFPPHLPVLALVDALTVSLSKLALQLHGCDRCRELGHGMESMGEIAYHLHHMLGQVSPRCPVC